MKRGAILWSVLAAVAFGGCSGGPSERSTRTVSDALNSSRGTEFWLMFEQNYYGAVQLTLFIAGERATSGQVDVPGLGFSQAFTVTPGAVTSIVLPAGDYATGSGNVENKGIHVTAQDEITVYGLNRQQYTTDAFLGLPVDILGTEYLALGYGNTYASSEFGVVATADGTTVTVTPSVATAGHAAGVPFTVALNAGQVYQLQSGGPGDLSGSIVQADHPVGVFAGHTCTTIPDTSTGYCDHVVEQMPPTTTWGRRFLTVPLATRTRGDTFRFLAATSGTTVTVNGTVVATLSRGQFHQQELAVPALVEASAPILVAQYSNGTTWDGVTSDPFMMLIPPYEQFLASYTVTTPASGFRTNYINVVAPAAAVGVLTLDAAVVPSTSFTAIGATGFLGAQLPVGLGAHNLAANRPFGVFVYGFDDADSYGYPGGMSLARVATVTTVTLTPATATARVGEAQCFDATVRDQDGLAVPGVRVDFTVTGANAVSAFATASASGVAQLCYAGAAVGVDQVVGAVGLIQGTAAMTWTPLAPAVDPGGPYAVDEGGQLKLYASSTLPGTLEYAWDLDGDGVFEYWGDVGWLSAARIDGPAVLPVAVRVRNELGDEAVGRTTVTVRNVAPTGNLYFSSQYRPEGSTFTMYLGAVTDAAPADRPGIRVAFDCGDGKGFGPLGTVKTITCAATDDGDRDVGARLVDKDGGVRDYRDKVRVYNRAPVATIAAPAALTAFAVGAPVDLLVRFTDAGVLDTHRCLVTWGDGTVETGVVTEAGGAGTCAATHVFPTSGTFKIIVNVSDNAGDDTTRYVTVYVR